MLRTACRVVLLLVPCAFVTLAAPPARAAFRGGNGRILVEPNGAAAFTMGADGSNHSLVTGYDSSGAGSLSADGGLEAFATGGSGLEVRTLATGDDARIVASGTTVSSPVFSPDGTQVAWQQAGATIMRAPADGSGDPQLVAAPGPGEHFGAGIAWTPDGSEIVVGTAIAGDACDCSVLQVLAVNATAGTRRPLTPPGDPVEDNEEQALAPDVAGDGSRVVFLEDVSPPTDPSFTAIAVVPLAGGSAQPLRTAGHGELALPRFSPDGTTVVYLGSRADARRQVRAMSGAGAGDHLVDDAAGAGYGSMDSLQWLPECADADGDALCDTWEEDGLDVDGNGSVELDLPAMGAAPDHKDIFIEIDAMTHHAIEQAAVDSMVKAFADAPVANPDGTTGIALHVDNGSASVMDPATGATWGALSDHETLPHRDVLGTVAGAAYDWSAFAALKAAHLDDVRRPVFHYVIGAHQYGSAKEFSSGISRGIGASDLIVSLGGCRPPGGADCNFDAQVQAGTLMHELGHNLGLQHGGADSVNRKPTYLSVMNYAFQVTWLVQFNNSRVLDYSRFSLAVDERKLDEEHGYGVRATSSPALFDTIAKDCSGTDVLEPVIVSRIDFRLRHHDLGQPRRRRPERRRRARRARGRA